jgi:hypothetical protein
MTMRRTSFWRSAVVATIVAVGLLLPVTRGHADPTSRDALTEWLNKYHDENARYVVFPNGQIFTARAKWTGILIGHLNLWHCFEYLPLRYRGDEALYMKARVVHFLDQGAEEMAAQYKTQCALGTYAGWEEDPDSFLLRTAQH